MTMLHGHRRNAISDGNSIRNTIRALAHGRTQASFGAFLAGGPYGGLSVLGPQDRHQDNGDFARFGDSTGNFSKGLAHDPQTGLAPGYAAFAARLEDIAERSIPPAPTLGSAASVADADALAPARPRAFVNPLAGVATDPVGLDPFDIAIPPAPALGSPVAAAEMVELYWMALLRDLPFADWAGHADVTTAIDELNLINLNLAGARLPLFTEHYRAGGGLSGDVTIDTLFRGSAPGNDRGGYISKFLLENVRFGTLDFDQMQNIPACVDYMTRWGDWLAVQEGKANPGFKGGTVHTPGRKDVETDTRRPISTLRDLAHYVHYDALHEAYFNAALILLGRNAPPAATSIYGSRGGLQQGFGTFGGPFVLTILTEVATRALKCVWHQKWYVHRRLRPEAYGGRLEAVRLGHPPGGHPPGSLTHDIVEQSAALARTRTTWGTHLLPQAFPEGSPMHPSYGAGHATVAGACVTILKALFDTGHSPADWHGLTVGGELNKLAANIGIGRNAAGVHYRSDYTKSLALGEAVALATLQEHAPCFAETAGAGQPVFAYPNFSGETVKVFADGRIGR